MSKKFFKELLTASKPIIMGILNLTPDSFSDGLPETTAQVFLEKAETLIAQGAHVLDVGAESTRPGAEPISVENELGRLLPFLQIFREKFPQMILSLDTRQYDVAVKAMAYDIAILNDTSFLADYRLAQLAKKNHAFYVLMHSRGTPATMNQMTEYGRGILETLFLEVYTKLKKLEAIEFPLSQVILDPGFGFAKTAEQCVTLMQNLDEWRDFSTNYRAEVKMPLLLGISRKSFLRSYIGDTSAQERDLVSSELAVKAYLEGFQIIRTHNVALTINAFKELS